MSDYQAALAHSATASAAAAARPRISADAFRNLTARLKKADVQIPSLSPVAPAPAPIPVALVPVSVETPTPLEPVVAIQVEPRVEVALPVEPQPAPIFAEVVALEPIGAVLPKPPQEEHAPEVLGDLQAESEAVMAVLSESHSSEPAHDIVVQPMEALGLPAFEPLQPVVVEADIGILPQGEALPSAPVHQAEPTVDLGILPVAEARFDIEALPQSVDVNVQSIEELPVADVATIDVADLPSAIIEVQPEEPKLYPDLPEFVPTPVAVTAPVADEPELQGSFAENFTYVPENGKEAEAAKVDLTDVSEAIKQEVAQRATELALENNWRLLLAKPTAEDRATYLREAAEYHASDEEWNKPAPEHDLSQIVPAGEADESAEALYVPQVAAGMERSLVDTMPTATGQDLSEVARSLLDMMAAGNASGLPQERALAADTLLRLVPRLELKPVVLLAQRLAMMDNPPNLLVARLIRDPRVEVAGPLLEDCSQISDQDLESVVQEGEPDKLRMIARRRKLSRAISDALIKSGDVSVVLTLVRNAEAEISHDGFASLLVLCENNPELLAPLATRKDLSAPFAFEMFWLAPAQLRRFILSRFLTDSETLTKILKITMATNTVDEAEAEPLSQHAMLEALERAARGHTEVASEELANLMQLGATTVQRILGDLEGDPLVVMLKAAGYPRSAVPGLLKRMQDADLPVISRERDITELQNMFETLSFNKARILLTYWDWAQKKLGPYAPVQ